MFTPRLSDGAGTQDAEAPYRKRVELRRDCLTALRYRLRDDQARQHVSSKNQQTAKRHIADFCLNFTCLPSLPKHRDEETSPASIGLMAS